MSIKTAKHACLIFALGALSLQHTQAQPPLSADLIRVGLYVIHGPAGNTLLRLTADGLLFVDGQPANCFAALMATARKISMSDQPVRALVLTHYNPQRMESNDRFMQQNARIIAQADLAKRLPPGGSIFVFDREYTVRGGGVEVKLLHVSSGRTVAYFPDQKVIAVGDLLASAPPKVDSVRTALAEILKLDFDVVVPATGPLGTRADLENLKLRIDSSL